MHGVPDLLQVQIQPVESCSSRGRRLYGSHAGTWAIAWAIDESDHGHHSDQESTCLLGKTSVPIYKYRFVWILVYNRSSHLGTTIGVVKWVSMTYARCACSFLFHFQTERDGHFRSAVCMTASWSASYTVNNGNFNPKGGYRTVLKKWIENT